jgi:integrase
MNQNDKERTWTTTKVQNLYRHKSGGYYGRFAIAGKKKWVSLKTKVFTTAKLRLTDQAKQVAEMRSTGATSDAVSLKMGQLIDTYLVRIEEDAAMAVKTKQGRKDGVNRILKTWDGFEVLKPQQIQPAGVAEWSNRLRTKSEFSRPGAKTVHKGFSADAVNKAVDTVINLLDIAVEKGAIMRNQLRRLPPGIRIKHAVQSKKPDLPPTSVMRKILEELEAPPELSPGLPPHLAKLLNADRRDVADFARFLAYSGARLSEAGAMTWEHIHGDTMTIPGTKTNTSRNRIVPVMRAAEDLFVRMRKDRTERGEKCEGPMFKVKECQKSINRACKDVGALRITHHDFRHYFATVSIESGVDIPTVSRWLGHADGGALAMKTYGHLRQEHSIAQALKVRF